MATEPRPASVSEPSAESPRQSTATLPHSLEIISERLPLIQPPKEVFDPNDEWDLRYIMWIGIRGSAGKSHQGGSLRIRRRPAVGGDSRLHITHVTNYGGPSPGVSLTQAVITCAADQLSTPKTWEVTSGKADNEGRPLDLTRVEFTGEVTRDTIIQRCKAERRTKAPKRLTSNWSLFDAVQRLPFDAKPVSFDMLEDMELMKPEQRLYPGRSIEVELGGRPTRLHSFEQIGRGILPYTYWLDDQHRLLMAIGGVCAFLYDPDVSIPEDQ